MDLERIVPQSIETAASSLSKFEANLFTDAGLGLDTEWPLRVFCAKEAVGKAIGRGLAGNIANLELVELNPKTGTVVLRVAGTLLRDFPKMAQKHLMAETLQDNGFIVAGAVLN